MTDEFEKPSKSALKRAAHELEDLGVKLLQLPERKLAELDLPDRLRDALDAARNMHSHGALRRQYQYIGKIMRDVDAEPIRAAISELERHHRQQADNLHDLEHWRERLLENPAQALDGFVARYPGTDAGMLRQLVNNARQAGGNDKAAKAAARALFRFLRDATVSDEHDDESAP